MADLMYTPLENVFAATMEREGKTVTAWSNGKEFTAFFRRCDDGQSTEDRIMVYYGVDAPVEQGALIQYGRKIYILMNKETEENTCYYKSYGIATNGLLNSNNGTIKDIPIYGFDMKDGVAYADKVFTMINGSMEFITENTGSIKILNINDTFNIYGRTFKTDNIYMKDGLFHIVAQVTSNQDSPSSDPDLEPITTVKIEASSYKITIGGGYKTLTAKIYDDNNIDITDQYSNASFVWSCMLGGEDYTDQVIWIAGAAYNQKKIKMNSGRTQLGKTMTIKCVVDNIIIGTKEFEISAL